MAVVVGSFETQSQAEDAVVRLKEAGFPEGDLAVVSNAADPVGAPKDQAQRAVDTVDVATAGAAIGAIVGGALLGPVGAVLGGMAGGAGLASALSSRGMSPDEARAYEARLRAGRYMLAVEAETPERERAARAVLQAAGADEAYVRSHT